MCVNETLRSMARVSLVVFTLTTGELVTLATTFPGVGVTPGLNTTGATWLFNVPAVTYPSTAQELT